MLRLIAAKDSLHLLGRQAASESADAVLFHAFDKRGAGPLLELSQPLFRIAGWLAR
ncbi:MAG TPA: hypothetical protein VF119_04545 [Candidatus Limnocylindrales bacterium]